MDDFVKWIAILILLIYGLYMVVWPEKALERFMSQYDLMAPKWHKAKAGEREELPAGLFQLAGGGLVVLSLFLIYCLIR